MMIHDERDTRPTVLVVDDTEDIRELLRLQLEALGYRVVEARDGGEALAVARSECPALILMDLSMPGMDGIEAMRHLREQSETVQLPVIAVTAHHHDTAWRRRALNAGCTKCVGKPVNFQELERLMSEALGG